MIKIKYHKDRVVSARQPKGEPWETQPLSISWTISLAFHGTLKGNN